MATNASPLARLAPTRLRLRARYLALPSLLATLILAFIFSGGSKAQREVHTALHCVLAFPPSQVGRAQLELVYCKSLDAHRQCQTDFGWIIVSEPVPCD